MNVGDSDFYEINELTGDVTFDLSKEELIVMLKNTGVICTHSKEQEKSKSKVTKNEHEITFGLKLPEDDAKTYTKRYLKKLRNIGKIDDEDEDHVNFVIDNVHIGFRVSPRIKILDLDGNTLDLRTSLFEKEVSFEKGEFILYENKKESEVLDFFNSVISVFNILNVPFDFVRESETMNFVDLIFKNGVVKEGVCLYTSKKAVTRGAGCRVLQLQMKDFLILLEAVDQIYQYVKSNDVLSAGDIYIFLGYGRYYHFHKDYLLAFANTWMFIEATINLMWEKMMVESGFSIKYLKGIEREWSLQEKIDVLLLKDRIDKITNENAQKLRSIRNKVFHVSKDVDKRKINEKISEECIDLGLRLFYHNIDFLDSGHIISFDDIALAIEHCIVQNPFYSLTPDEV